MASVLIIDDEESIRVTLREFLLEEGYEVHTAADAETALKLFDETDFDVAVTDIILPRTSGIELLHSIRKSHPNTKVVLITGDPTVETAVNAVRAGAHDYIDKPITRSAIRRAVKGAVDVKVLEDRKRELEEENLQYQEHLEELVQKRTAEVVQKEQYFRALIENAPDIIMLVDGEARVTYFSPSVEKVMGYTPTDLIGKRSLDYIHPDDLPETMEAFGRLIENPGRPITMEHRVLHKDGSWRLVESTGTNLLQNESVNGIVANMRDITDHK